MCRVLTAVTAKPVSTANFSNPVKGMRRPSTARPKPQMPNRAQPLKTFILRPEQKSLSAAQAPAKY